MGINLSEIIFAEFNKYIEESTGIAAVKRFDAAKAIARGKKVKVRGYKKAIITLKKGQNIDLTTGIWNDIKNI